MTLKQFRALAKKYAERCVREIGFGKVNDYDDSIVYDFRNEGEYSGATMAFEIRIVDGVPRPEARFGSGGAMLGAAHDVAPFYEAMTLICKIGSEFNAKHGQKVVTF